MDDFESMVETVRMQLSRGMHLEDDVRGSRPYAGAARLMTSVMYGQGYRKVNEPKIALESALSSEHAVWVALTGTLHALQDEHDKIKSDMKTNDDYQRGVLHGLDKAIVDVREKIELCDANISHYTIQLQHVLERDRLNP